MQWSAETYESKKQTRKLDHY